MKKHLIVIGTVVLLLVVGLSGCNEINLFSGDNRFVGTWKSNGSTITFFSDGEGSEMGIGFQWEIKDDKLVRETDITGVLSSMVYNYQFSNNDTSLTLTDVSSGTTFNYTKQ